MVDLVDMASEVAAIHLAEALHRQQRAGNTSAVSAEFCEDCDEPIPQRRREAVPGCQTCIDCQGLREVRCV